MEASDRVRLVGYAGEWPLQIFRRVFPGRGDFGHLEHTDLSISLCHTIPAALELDVDFARLKKKPGDLAALPR